MLIDIKPSFVENMQVFMKNINIYGGFYYQWYVGITTDPQRSFLIIHKLDMLRHNWILSSECSDHIAVIIKKALISIGCTNDEKLDLCTHAQMTRVYLYKMEKMKIKTGGLC